MTLPRPLHLQPGAQIVSFRLHSYDWVSIVVSLSLTVDSLFTARVILSRLASNTQSVYLYASLASITLRTLVLVVVDLYQFWHRSLKQSLPLLLVSDVLQLRVLFHSSQYVLERAR